MTPELVRDVDSAADDCRWYTLVGCPEVGGGLAVSTAVSMQAAVAEEADRSRTARLKLRR